MNTPNTEGHMLPGGSPLHTPDNLKADSGSALNALLSEVNARPHTISAKEAIIEVNRNANPLSLIADLNPSTSPQSPQRLQVQQNPVQQIVPVVPVISKATAPEIPKAETLLETQESTEPETDLDSVKKSYNELLKTHKEIKKTFNSVEEAKTSLEKEVEAYKAGEKQPEELTKLRTRVAELEPLEELVNFKKTDAYREKFIEPLNNYNTKLKTFAKDYSIPENVLEQAAEIKDQRKLNAFLIEHFDDIGQREAKDLIQGIQKVRGELNSFEAKPKDFYQHITEEHALLKQQEEVSRAKKIETLGKGAWAKTLLRIQTEGKVQEIIPREGDDDFNNTWAKPIQEKAASEYGKILSALYQAGVKHVNPELLDALATASIMNTVAPTAIERANTAEAKLAELEANIDRGSRMARPSMGSVGAGARGSSAPPQEIPSQERSGTHTVGADILRAQGIFK